MRLGTLYLTRVLVAVATGVAPTAFAQTCVDGSPCNPSSLNKVVYAFGMKCDGSTNDAPALAALTGPSLPPTTVVIPPGICILNTGVDVKSPIWLKGGGASQTTLRLPSGTNSYLLGISSNVTISDLTLDGNKVPLQTMGNHVIVPVPGSTGLTGIKIRRNRFVNAFGCAIGIFMSGTPRILTSDYLIDSNDFSNNGSAVDHPGTQSGGNGDICIPAASLIRVTNNHSDSAAGDFVILGTGMNTTGVGDVTIDHNQVTSGLGFAVALGGGGPGEAGGNSATISNNTFSMPGSIENIVDLAFWHNVIVSGNNITTGYNGAGIGDNPPAFGVTATGNQIQGLGPYTASLSAASNASGGHTTYTGVFSPPLRAGYVVTISGFQNGGNNCTPSKTTPCTVVSGTGTTLVLNSSTGTAETHAATLKLNNSFNAGIGLGGPFATITGNIVSNLGSVGILIDANPVDSVQGSIVNGNTIINCGQGDNTPGTSAGIALFINPMPPATSTMSGVLIAGNTAFNNVTSTQGYGLSIGSPGSKPSGFSNITVTGNDFRGNTHPAGIQIGTDITSGVSITNNAGWNDLAPKGGTNGNIGSLHNWGTGATVSNTNGSSSRATTIITTGTSPGVAPTFVYTFPAPFPIAPICTSTLQGGTGTLGVPNGATSTTTAATITYAGTPTAGSYLFVIDCRPPMP
jgi:hypothetical protein